MAISQPPPSAWPLIAAMIGLGNRSILRITLLPKRMNVSTSPPAKAEPRSAPAQKIRSPAPVMITARTASSPCSSLSAAFSSRIELLADRVGGRPVERDDREALLAGRTSSVSYAIARHSFEEDRGHRRRRRRRDGSPACRAPRRSPSGPWRRTASWWRPSPAGRRGSARPPRPPPARSRSARSRRRPRGRRRRGRTCGPAAARPAPPRPASGFCSSTWKCSATSRRILATGSGSPAISRRTDATHSAIFSRKSVTRISSFVLK